MRTDKPEAELGLYDDARQLGYTTWLAHRQLAETIHRRIEELLTSHQKELSDIEGIVCFKGPGSFTGLRIGMSVANALAYSYGLPIVAADADWIEQGISALLAGKTDTVALPEYGAPALTTPPKK